MTNRLKFYESALTQSVKANVERHLKLLPGEQLSLLEEVAIQREFTGNDLERCFQAQATMLEAKQIFEAVGTEEAKQLYLEAQANFNAAANIAKNAIKEQSDLNTKAAAVEDRVTKTIAQSNITFFIQAVLQLVHEKFNKGTMETESKLLEFEQELRDRVLFEEADGRSLAIEAEYNAIMSSVPKYEE